MLEIRITAPELSEAINNLAKAMTSRATTNPVGIPIGAVPTNTTSVPVNGQTEPHQAAPTEAVVNPTTPVSAQATVPVAQNTPNANCSTPNANTAPVQTVPTAPPQYTCDMIAKAGATLVEAGKMNELLALLARFGVEAVTSLDPAQYGAFATELRALGASI